MNFSFADRLFRVLLVALSMALLGTDSASAQKGSIRGVLVDSETGETLIGVNVIISGTSIGSTTDLDGRYLIQGLDPGTYTLRFSYIGYNTKTVESVTVESGKTTRVDLSLSPETIGLEEVVIEAQAVRNAEAALLKVRQKAAAVSDAISAEAIGRSGSGNAATVMTKVTGASVVGGKYVYVRGLGERYSSTHLNGAELPSADPDRKAFQLDLFPSSLLDNIVTTKTFTPDKPGNFSGGLVNVGTKNYPDRLTIQLSTSSTFNTQTTFADDFLTFPGGDAGLIRFNGRPGLPDIFNNPDFEMPRDQSVEILARRDPALAAELDRITKAFDPIMTPTVSRAPINRSFSAAVGNQVQFFGRPLGFTGSLIYAHDYSSYNNGEVGRYLLVGGQVDEIENLTPTRIFGNGLGNDTRSTQEVSWGGLGTLSFKPHPRHSVSTTYLYTRSDLSEARYLAGYWQDLSNENSTFETRVLGFKERTLNSLQISGEHAFGITTAAWNASYAENTQEEPDLRYFSNHYTEFEQDGQIERNYQRPTSLYPAPTRFFRDLAEDNLTAGADLDFPLKLWIGRSSKIKVGGSFLRISRDFNERRFEYREGRGISYPELKGDNDAYFSKVGVLGQASNGQFLLGNYIIEATSLKNNYTGEQTISAGYAMADLLLTRRLRVIGGARLESTLMETVSEDASLPEGKLDVLDILPALNLVYGLGDNMNVRAAATQTLARPTFRELAPYSTFDFVGDFVFSGNANLKRTLITNLDLRWEWFMRPGEIFAISGFFKQFQNPIERVILSTVNNGALTVQNVDEGRVYGIELEARKRLDTFGFLLRNFQLGGNLSLVHSEVNISEEELFTILISDPAADDKRRLQGQSPYLVNLDLAYENATSGTTASLYYNAFGARLHTVALGATPDIYERPLAMLDFVISQRLVSGFKAKLSAKNLLDSDALQSQTFKGRDYVYQQYKNGRSFSLGISYEID